MAHCLDGCNISVETNECRAEVGAWFAVNSPALTIRSAAILVVLRFVPAIDASIDSRIALAHFLFCQPEEVDHQHVARRLGQVASVAVAFDHIFKTRLCTVAEGGSFFRRDDETGAKQLVPRLEIPSLARNVVAAPTSAITVKSAKMRPLSRVNVSSAVLLAPSISLATFNSCPL